MGRMNYRLRHIALAAAVLITALRTLAVSSPTTAPTSAPSTQPANKIVYVLDATGSMMHSLADAKRELEKSINGLKEDQQFTIHLFKDKPGPGTMFRNVPVQATDAAKRDAIGFLQGVMPFGAGNPAQTLVTAMRAQPDLILFVSDGDFKNDDIVLRDVQRQFAIRRVTINCCVASDKPDNRDRMYRIAERTGGRCFDLQGQPVNPQSQSQPTSRPSIFDP